MVAATRRAWRRWPLSARLLIALLIVIAIVEIVAVYAILPGRFPATYTAVQPDSVAYICQGLKLSRLSGTESSQISSAVFGRFGYPLDSCALVEPVMPWQVLARPLLPAMIALVSGILGTPWAPLVPSILVFCLLVFLWLRIVVRVPAADSLPGPRTNTERRLRTAVTWAAALAPFAAFTMILWPLSVLTEGPITVASLLAVMVLAASREYRPRRLLIALGIIGCTLLLTRQYWPVVAAVWAAGMFTIVWPRQRPSGVRALAWGTAIIATALLLAIGLARGIEAILVPPGWKEAQPYVPEGLPVGALPSLVWSSLTSTANDVGLAIGQADVLSPLVLAGGLVAVIVLLRQRAWAVASVCLVTWALGLYSVGLVHEFDAASRTHLRFLVPAVLISIAGALLVTRMTHTGEAESRQSGAGEPFRPVGRD